MVDFFEKIYFKYKEFWWHLFFGILNIGACIGLYFVALNFANMDSLNFYLLWIGLSLVAVAVFSVIENQKLIDLVDALYFKYKEVFWYLVFGVLTTIINLVTYYILRFLFGEENLLYLVWTAVAWLVAVIFAYVTNRKYVFESKSTEAAEKKREFISFIACRLLSGILDVGFMYITVSIFLWSDSVMKIVSNIIVVILNYIFSKLFVFKKD